ncbi:DICT sensory domain-containing protein [Nocardioides coralli]|uniref:DICT sensory domain-containing protein n=1 Tax=Nocardioides coralli TaxID=2872154 RepID=UPI001CA3D261|nr:DICT sensory domain-containing protein [Nocardioides coralli]QZY30557.1 MerR family transcriptional regulator [Nocardioides coralli]
MSTETTKTQGAPPAPDTLLTIGELAAHTGLTPELLRTWETRHGFPEPIRLPSGHRRYTGDDVRAVQRVLEERDHGVRLEQAIAAAVRAGSVEDSGSVYAALSARHPTLPSYTLTKRTLLALSWAIEDESVAAATQAVLIGTFQKARYFGHSRARWEDLARTARGAMVMANFTEHDDDARPVRVALPDDSPLLREWIVVCDGASLAAVLVAIELPGQDAVPEPERHFEAIWSVEGRIVRDAAAMTAGAGAALGSEGSRRVLGLLEDAPPPAPASTRNATAVFNRMVAYTDGTVLRGRGKR